MFAGGGTDFGASFQRQGGGVMLECFIAASAALPTNHLEATHLALTIIGLGFGRVGAACTV